MKAIKKLLPGIAMLLISAVVMTTASFAWFTISREVEANSMNVTVMAPNNLLISQYPDRGFSGEAEITAATGLMIVPASSVAGVATEFYTLDNFALASGARDVTSTFHKSGAATATQDGAYADFTFYLKTDNPSDVTVGISNVELTQGAGNSAAKIDGLNAVRFAIADIGYTDSSTGATVASAPVVWGRENADRTEQTTPGTPATTGRNTLAINSTYTEGTPVNELTDLWEISYLSLVDTTAANSSINNDKGIFNVAASSQKITKIVVRVWIDGEDAYCNAEDASNLNFNLKIRFADIKYIAH